ncbi:MAG: hypothetical protein LBD99_07695, partial [Candidatus Margulisbacteria bacterium]|nr:hypothetical protein [Candidatus Margulisiibacteriota bacterium]
MMSNEPTIGFEDFVQVFSKYAHIVIFFTLLFFAGGLALSYFSSDVYRAEATIYSKGLEKGFSDESGHDVLAVSRLPIVYKETALRMLDQDLISKNIIAGRSLNAEQRGRLRSKIRQNLQAIAQNDSFVLSADSPDERLLGEILQTTYYDDALLRRGTQVNFIGKSAIVEIIYSSSDPEKTVQFINLLTDVFVPKYNRIYSKKIADRNVSRLEQEKIEIMQDYTAKKQSLDIINQRLAQKGSRRSYIAVQRVRQNPKVEALQTRLKNAKTREEAARIEAQIDQQLATIWVDDQWLEYIDPDTKQILQDQIKAELLFQDASSRLDIINANIDYYRQDSTLAAIPTALNVFNYAGTPDRQKTIPLLHVLILAFIGFFLSNWFIFMLDAAHPDLKISDLEKKSGKKTLVMFPIDYKSLAMDKELAYFFLTLEKNKTKTVLFTSQEYKEGKTYVASALAEYAASRLGKKVLLIDANHNNPSLGRLYKLGKTGFSDVLADLKITPEMAQPQPNLFVLPFGSMPLARHIHNLGQGKALEAVVRSAERRFDYVFL